MKHVCGFLLLASAAAAATFGTVVQITGSPTDLVIDEARNRVYVVNSTQNRVEVYSVAEKRLLASIATDQQPLGAGISRDRKWLYVTSYGASVLDVIDLDAGAVVKRVSLPAAPEGVAVGADERVLVTTTGSSASDTTTRLLLYDPNASDSSSLATITSTLPAPTTPTGQAYNTSRSQLMATPDGSLIVGVNIPNTSTRTVFVYEVASATVLRSRSASNLSSVLSVSPDGSRLMSGLSLFDAKTLAIVAQQNAANSLYPFQSNVNFNLQQNQGGSVFAPDGQTLYSAFNIAPVQNPAARANTSQLMLSDPDHLLIRLGLQMPENLTGKMAITSNGATIFALSQSGMLVLPVSTIYDYPIASVEQTSVLLATDQCSTTNARTGQVAITNAGRGRMTVTAQLLQGGVTFTFPIGGQTGGTTPGGGGTGGGPGGGGPGQTIPIVIPGGGGQITIPPGAGPTTGSGSTTTTTTQQNAMAQLAPQVSVQLTPAGATARFTFNSNAARSLGTTTPADFLVQSSEAINIPFRIRVYQNYRNVESAGSLMAVPVSVSTAEGIVDLVLDSRRQRLYLANSGLNRVEVFDTRANEFRTPIKVGQLPRSLAMTPDGNTLYVANSGGESVSIIDLEKGVVTGSVAFPPLPYNAAYAVTTPSVIAATLSGLQMIMNNGSLWKVVSNEATPRSASTVIGTATLQAPRSIIATPEGEYALLLAGSGVAYLYDAVSDEYVLSQQVATTPIQGYFGPMAAGPRGQYFIVNGQVLNRSLTPVGSITSSRSVAAVAAVNATTFARFAQPVRANANATVSELPTVELVDANSGMTRGSAQVLEGPLSTQTGTARVNVGARTMVLNDAGTTAYVLTSSGVSIAPIASGGPGQQRISINPSGVVNTADYTAAIAPNSVVSIFGQNLGADATNASSPVPLVLGGTCVTLDSQPMALFMSSAGQINAQIPPDTAAGRHSVVVRSADRKVASTAQSITVAKYAPAVFKDAETGEALVFHRDGSRVSKSKPAKRDEALMVFATGLGVPAGSGLATGVAAPVDTLVETDTVQVFFGTQGVKEAEMIVEWSGLAPGLVGVYQINIRVPGARVRGEALPVSIRIGGVSSATSGSGVPVTAVE